MNDAGFVDHCLELLSPLGSTRAARMFGGHGLYIDDLCMALVFRDALYLKVNEANRAAFEAAHCKPFVYETKNGEKGSLSYFTAPEEAMESPHEMIPWARRALEAAVAARTKSAPKRKKPLAAKPGKAAKKAGLISGR
jgi:DNA transformation protein